MGIQKRALENAANTTAASRFAVKDYMGGQTITTIPYDKFPKSRSIVVDVAPWLFIAHMRHCFDASALSASLTKLRRAVLVPEVWAAMLVARATFLVVPYEVEAAARSTERATSGSSRVALCFDNDYSVPGSGRKYVEHIYRDLHRTSSALPAAEDGTPSDEGSGSSDDTVAAEEPEQGDCAPGSSVAAAVVEVDWDGLYQYSIGAAPDTFVRGGPSVQQPTKRGQRYEFYAAVLACLEDGAIPPLIGELILDDGRDSEYRCVSSGNPSTERQILANIKLCTAAPPFRPMHLSASLSRSRSQTAGCIQLDCYGFVRALHKQREALLAILGPLVGQGILTMTKAKEATAENLRHAACLFKPVLGEELCVKLADEVYRNSFAWVLEANNEVYRNSFAWVLEPNNWGHCQVVPRGAPACAEGERLALVFLRRWVLEPDGGRTIFMCEDSDGPMQTLQLLSWIVCEQHNTNIEASNSSNAGPMYGSVTVMRFREGKYQELDYAFMAEALATRVMDALTNGLQQHAERRKLQQAMPSRELRWTRATELVGMVAAMMFFVGSDYVQDPHRLVPDFPMSLHPARLTRAVLRTIHMVAEAVGPDLLRSDHALYVSPRHHQHHYNGVKKGLSPVMCALVVAVMMAEEHAHGSRFRCGEKNNAVVMRKPSLLPTVGRRRRRPDVMGPGSLMLCRREMRAVRFLFPQLVGCAPSDCGLKTPVLKTYVQSRIVTKKSVKLSIPAATQFPCLNARASIYACPHTYPLLPPPSDEALTAGGTTPKLVAGKRKRGQEDGQPAAKRRKRGPVPMQSQKISATKFSLYRDFAAAVGGIPGSASTVHRFASSGLRTGKRPTKKSIGTLCATDLSATVAVLRGQIARLVCEDWLLHAYIHDGQILDCTARAADGDPLFGYSMLPQPPQSSKVYEKMTLEWPRRLIVDSEAMQCARVCLRGYRDTGY